MKILVCAKRVPDRDAIVKLKADGSGPDLENVAFEINPFDQNALEEALKIVEKLGTGEIIAVSIGPEVCQEQLRTALAMGASRGILVETDKELDSYSVAEILAEICKREKPDLILMGKQSPDTDCCQAAQMLAELPGWPQALFAAKIEISEDKLKARVVREVDCGQEVVEVQLPAVITADLRLNEPRYASLPMIMKARSKPCSVILLQDLGLDLSAKAEVVKFESVVQERQAVIVESAEELAEKLAELEVF